jgi:hypothetical protein
MVLQRVLLTRHALTASFLNQPLERPHLRLWVSELVRPAGYHMVLRVGQRMAAPWGHGEAMEATARRPLHAFYLPPESGPDLRTHRQRPD